ncbi:RagB/SusD family nutrient uptake outer membrane protein [Spirosoma sordidisoli]|uniref:RagB/SusD family nutrient uptake outer membrane protein n=1 Tax=Spirosoma sordidisoli TaxID=2502893 RepID=A0A4Q2UPY1_9BACT|nr:RagB/SusD family nutrient uptake outer membrane protein [Spirosoma sordidisoli]RYC70992.1 RagB/SusD family nutrient uptake outer membrane protein [Spirosoma sordidisoli]
MKIKYISLVLLALLSTACEESFLEQVPVTERSEVNFYKTTADFNNAVVGVYATLKNPGLYGGGSGALFSMSEIITDNTDLGVTRQPVNLPIFEIDDYLITISNATVGAAWTGHYLGIARTNAILDRLPATTIPQASKDRFEGEAKFMRAMFYFNLVRFFGDVQLLTSEVSSPYGANDLPRSPAAQVYELIVNDLKAAEEKLPATIANAEAGRASRWAAKSLLGKVYLTLKQYDNAAAKLKEVVDSKAHDLMPSYASVFANTTSFAANREVIFAVQYLSGQIGQGSDMWSNWAPFNAGTVLLGTGGGGGGGFNRPTADLVKAYEAGDVRKDASLLTTYKNAQGRDVADAYVVKFRQQGALNADSDVDFPILRYADVLLMYAEALNEQGKTADALPFLNQVRKRAGLADKTGLTQATMRLALEDERRVELAFENHRWFDLLRTDRYMTVLTAKGLKVLSHQKLYPIPLREIDLNKKLTQNTGY